MKPLDAKVAAITGGAGGIGSEIARQLRAAGARVFSLDFAENKEVESISCDVREEASIEAAIA
jgi:NAD(P)-dependent dehydrogenase (short-subunit alcohol dehydrogenase family)